MSNQESQWQKSSPKTSLSTWMRNLGGYIQKACSWINTLGICWYFGHHLGGFWYSIHQLTPKIRIWAPMHTLCDVIRGLRRTALEARIAHTAANEVLLSATNKNWEGKKHSFLGGSNCCCCPSYQLRILDISLKLVPTIKTTRPWVFTLWSACR